MKIVEIKCQECESQFETLEAFPPDQLKCPACGSKKLDRKVTEREFEGCGGSCGNCSGCEE